MTVRVDEILPPPNVAFQTAPALKYQGFFVPATGALVDEAYAGGDGQEVTIHAAIRYAQDTANAAGVAYDNTTSGLTATDVQAALDEIDARVDEVEAELSATTGALTAIGGALTTIGDALGVTPVTDAVNTALTEIDDAVNLIEGVL